jgi:hypothetical protein
MALLSCWKNPDVPERPSVPLTANGYGQNGTQERSRDLGREVPFTNQAIRSNAK